MTARVPLRPAGLGFGFGLFRGPFWGGRLGLKPLERMRFSVFGGAGFRFRFAPAVDTG